jgi:ASC-1-like (ASCH) protein
MQTIPLNIQEPYLSFILNGQKTIEGRLNKGKFKEFKTGDILLVGQKEDKFIIERLTIYSSFREMLEKEGIKNVIPDKNTIDEAEGIYYNFYTKEQEKEFGILAIKINKVCI